MSFKTIQIASIIILSILLSGCGKDKHKQITYQAEQLYYLAEKLYRSASIRPDLVEAETYNRVTEAYRTVVNYCWTNLDLLPPDKYPIDHGNLEKVSFLAARRLASIYLVNGKFDSSIIVYRQLLTLTRLSGNALLYTKASLARSLQYTGDWNSALNIYRSILDNFYPPITTRGEVMNQVIGLPLELIKTNSLLRLDNEADYDIVTAESYYIRLIEEWPNSQLENAARINLSAVYAFADRWQEAIDILENVIESGNDPENRAALLMANHYIDGKNDIQAAIDIYDRLVGNVDDSTKLAELYVRLANAHFNRGSYRRTREISTMLKNNFTRFFQSNPKPQDLIARAFELEGNWARAENEFLWLITNFPLTEESFDAYFRIADHYKEKGNSRLEQSWLARASEFYNEMAARYSGTIIEASAMTFLAEIARRNNQWSQAAELLEDAFNKYPKHISGRRSLITAAAVYREKLNNTERADSLLKLINIDIY
jgi:tetratricopeptide (TPR) repeat protein